MNEDGFTLIEALVALALGVAVVAVVLSTLHIASGSAARAVAGATQTEGFARAGDVLAGDAMHVLKLKGEEGLVFDGRAGSVMFPAVGRFGHGTVALRYEIKGGDLWRAEAPMLAAGPGPFGPGLVIWQGPGQWAFRYLDDKGDWRRDWTGEGLPRAFGLVDGASPQTVELVAEFPDVAEPDCALGPGDRCSLAAQVFP